MPPLLELLSFARIERLLVFAARLRIARAPDDAVAASWVDSRLYGKPRPWTLTCLRRAAILYHLLRSRGCTVDLCIGVRRDEHGELRAHAWLLRDGSLYLEPAQTGGLVPEFRLIAQFPPPASNSA